MTSRSAAPAPHLTKEKIQRPAEGRADCDVVREETLDSVARPNRQRSEPGARSRAETMWFLRGPLWHSSSPLIRDVSVARREVARRIFAQHLDIIRALGRGSSEQEFRIYLVFPDRVAERKRSAWIAPFTVRSPLMTTCPLNSPSPFTMSENCGRCFGSVFTPTTIVPSGYTST